MMMRVAVVGCLLLLNGSSAVEQKEEAHRFGTATWASRISSQRRSLAQRVEFKSDAPGTETVLLVKGGVGVDVDLRQDLLSTRNLFKKPKHHKVKAVIEPKKATRPAPKHH